MLEFMSKSIIAQRKTRGLTQEELAEKLDVFDFIGIGNRRFVAVLL